MLNKNIWCDDLSQDITSAATSINSKKLPRGITTAARIGFFDEFTTNLDMGGGKFENVTEFLKTINVENHTYDPYNRSKLDNLSVIDLISVSPVDTVTCNNVLNVIQEDEVKIRVIEQSYESLRVGGKAIFTVYNGNGSGVAMATGRDQWQENKPLVDYISMINDVFGKTGTKKYNAYIIHK